MSELLDDDVVTLKIKCTILPTMNETNIKVPKDGLVSDLSHCITSEMGIYPKHIIFRGDILDNLVEIDNLDIRKNESIFVVKRELSGSLYRSSSSQTSELVQQLLNIGHSVTSDSGSDVTVDFEITDGENPIITTESGQTAIDLLGNTLNQLFNASHSTVAGPPDPAVTTEETVGYSIPPPPPQESEYQYQAELDQILAMGYVDEVAIIAALEINNGDVSSSLVYL